jgi:hypothetical protein
MNMMMVYLSTVYLLSVANDNTTVLCDAISVAFYDAE